MLLNRNSRRKQTRPNQRSTPPPLRPHPGQLFLQLHRFSRSVFADFGPGLFTQRKLLPSAGRARCVLRLALLLVLMYSLHTVDLIAYHPTFGPMDICFVLHAHVFGISVHVFHKPVCLIRDLIQVSPPLIHVPKLTRKWRASVVESGHASQCKMHVLTFPGSAKLGKDRVDYPQWPITIHLFDT